MPPSTASKVHHLREPGTCTGCGAARAGGDSRCPRCGTARPARGWLRNPEIGEPIGGASAWVLGAPLEPLGPVLRFRSWANLGDGDREDRSLQGIAHMVSEPALFGVMESRSRVLENVRHPALRGCLEHGRHRGRPYRIDPYPADPPLTAVLDEQGAMPSEEIRRIALALADGLVELHALGVVHGHINPDTVVLATGYQGGNPVLADCPAVDAGPYLPFVAPEVALGQRPDPRSDLFGLGVTLTCLARGSGLEPGSGGIAWAEARPGPAVLVPADSRLSEGLRALILQLVDRDPSRRPRSATHVAEALRAVGVQPATTKLPLPDDELLFDLDEVRPLRAPGPAITVPGPPRLGAAPVIARSWRESLAAEAPPADQDEALEALSAEGDDDELEEETAARPQVAAAVAAAPRPALRAAPLLQPVEPSPRPQPAPAAEAQAQPPAPIRRRPYGAMALAATLLLGLGLGGLLTGLFGEDRPKGEASQHAEALSILAPEPEREAAASLPSDERVQPAAETAAAPLPSPPVADPPEAGPTPPADAVAAQRTKPRLRGQPDAERMEPSPGPWPVTTPPLPEPEARAGLGSASESDALPSVPLTQRLSGTWSGDSAGRPARFYLDFSADGTVRGSAEVRIGPRYVQKALVGRFRDDGGGQASLSLTETEGPKPSAWVGHFDGQHLVGEVQVNGRSSGSFAIAPAR